MSHAIQVEGLRKSYSGHPVLKGLSFHVNQGEIFALLGVNGAGKTTALSCIEGLLPYDEGQIAVNGKMGIQLQSASLPSHIRPMEAARLFAYWNHAEIDRAMLAALGVDQLGKKQYATLSTGQKRRLHLALALISDPDLLFLDEPTAGLDVEGRVSLHEQIRGLRARGKTILLASHDMSEVESLCDRLAILKDGAVAFLGTVEELNAKAGSRYSITIKTDQGQACYQASAIGETMLSLLEDYRQRGVAVKDIQISQGSLEQHFMEIARGDGQ